MEILRATRTAQQAAAYYVRIQAMARKHRIPLDAEFDEHDTPQTNYIVIMDDFLPVATCRLYGLDQQHVMLGRIVVLPEYRHRGLGTLVVKRQIRAYLLSVKRLPATGWRKICKREAVLVEVKLLSPKTESRKPIASV